MNGATIEERNYYAESYIALVDEIIKETKNIIKEIKMCIRDRNNSGYPADRWYVRLFAQSCAQPGVAAEL